jgi:hypothetical protein
MIKISKCKQIQTKWRQHYNPKLRVTEVRASALNRNPTARHDYRMALHAALLADLAMRSTVLVGPMVGATIKIKRHRVHAC